MKKLITLDENNFDKDGVFISKEFYDPEKNCYFFDGNVHIGNIKKPIFKESILVGGYLSVGGCLSVGGYLRVGGDLRVGGYLRVDDDLSVDGDLRVDGYDLLKRGIIKIGYIGSRNSHTIFYCTKENGIIVRCGCTFISLSDFEKKVMDTHGNSVYAKEYFISIEAAKKYYELYEKSGLK